MVVDLDRPQIPHSLSVASFRKMIVRLDRAQSPHSLPLASFRKMIVRLDRAQIPHSLPLALFGQISSRNRKPAYPAQIETGFVRRVFASPRIRASYTLPTAYCVLPTPNLTIAPDWTALATDAPRDSGSLDRKPGLTAAGYKISMIVPP
jgi:hypothetical protein